MRIHIRAVGRLRAGPELSLIQDYTSRFERTGRALGFGPVSLQEVEDKKGGGKVAEANLLAKSIPAGSITCALDERGAKLSSPEFAAQLAKWRDDGRADVTFLIGGADGLDGELRKNSDTAISLGNMVWPHMLVRVMLSEQLYRSASILAGNPYHRV